MLRLCSERSRPYPGRPVSRAIFADDAAAGNGCRDEAGVSRGHIRRVGLQGGAILWKRTPVTEHEHCFPAEGPNP